MNVFVIHSTKDAEQVAEKVSYIKRNIYSFNALILKNGNCFWKAEAASKIRKSQMVIFFIGKESYKSPYIAWEIQKAKQYQKPIYSVLLDEQNPKHPALLFVDEFSQEIKSYDKTVTCDELKSIISGHENEDYQVFNQDIDKIDMKILFEQYRLFLQTSETLVSRRQTVNSFYITVNSAFVALFSTMFGLAIDIKFKLLLVVILALVGIILATSWVKILISYGQLNASKMAIIRNIEKQLPASLYDAEWKALSDQLNKKRYVSFTNSEKRLPFVFIAIYICIVIVFAVMFVTSLI